MGVARDVGGVASFITIDEQLKQNRCCYFPHANYASLGLSLFLGLILLSSHICKTTAALFVGLHQQFDARFV